MKPRAVGLPLVVAFLCGAHGVPGIADQRAAPRARLQSFIPYPTVVNSPLAAIKAIAIPGAPLVSTDLLWVDQASERLYVADRSNFGIDIIDAENDTFIGRITGFVGPTGPRGGGPNGLLVTPDHKLWAGDGASIVQVVDLNQTPARIVQAIDTRGTNRTDELAYDPVDHIILIGNDRDTPPYATAISSETYSILGDIRFRDSVGLEQPVWNPQLHRFLLNVPSVGGRGAQIAVINPKTLGVEASYPVGNCPGTGLALGPFQRLLVACGTPIVMNAVNGEIISTITQVGSGDQVWYNQGDGQFYVTSTDPATGGTVLGVIDGLTSRFRQKVPAPGARNVAAFAGNNHVFAIVRAPAANAPDTTACASFGLRGSGCILVFAHSED